MSRIAEAAAASPERAESSRICAWMVTSSAVVGSSAIRSSGRDERHGDHDALAHAARELVRVVVEPVRRRRGCRRCRAGARPRGAPRAREPGWRRSPSTSCPPTRRSG